MATELMLPETHVLAIASHVTSGYVGNTMVTFCLQTLGCEVSAINTVNYSQYLQIFRRKAVGRYYGPVADMISGNHVGYRRVSGRKSTPEEVAELYQGLKNASLDDFDVLISGYCPSAALVEQVGKIAREIKFRNTTRPGAFFWVLDPVMGDNGRLYVAEETVPVYKSLLKDADLILPNQFEAELLSDTKILDISSLIQAISSLHQTHRLPHIIITSIRLPPTAANTPNSGEEDLTTSAKLSIIGSTATSDFKPRLFRITIPVLPVFFSGTGDMFASLMVARLRQAALEQDLLTTTSWQSPDEVEGPDLPLARTAEKVLASMHHVLKDTARVYDETTRRLQTEGDNVLNDGVGVQADEQRELQRHLRLTRAAEVRVVRNTQILREPGDLTAFRACAVKAPS